VVDLNAGQHTLAVKGLHEPQGVLFVQGLNRIYVANGEDGQLTIFEGTSFRPLHTIGFSGDVDNIR
jgi:hypothetical protein